mgnify:CR=1 FL=1
MWHTGTHGIPFFQRGMHYICRTRAFMLCRDLEFEWSRSIGLGCNHAGVCNNSHKKGSSFCPRAFNKASNVLHLLAYRSIDRSSLSWSVCSWHCVSWAWDCDCESVHVIDRSRKRRWGQVCRSLQRALHACKAAPMQRAAAACTVNRLKFCHACMQRKKWISEIALSSICYSTITSKLSSTTTHEPLLHKSM